MAQTVNEVGALVIALAERTNQLLVVVEKLAEAEQKIQQLESAENRVV